MRFSQSWPWVASVLSGALVFSLAVAGYAAVPRLRAVPVTGATVEPRWDGSSLLQTKAPAAELRKIAANRSLRKEERGKAVASLFANYLRPPQNGQNVTAVLGDAPWLADARLESVYFFSGIWIIDIHAKGTVFVLDFPSDFTDGRRYHMDFRLVGRDTLLTSDDARAFLTGRGKPGAAPLVLAEFSISFPTNDNTQIPRVERFSEKGIAVYFP
jgi:hypothetical protein